MNHDVIIKDGDAMSEHHTTASRGRKKKAIGTAALVGLCATAAAVIPFGGTTHAVTNENQGILCSDQGDSTSTPGTVKYTITAVDGYTSEPDGNAMYDWGFSDNSQFRLPGPVLCVHQGQVVKITLNNTLPVATSIEFPGQDGVTYGDGNDPVGPVTDGHGKLLSLSPMAAATNGSQTYTFTASRPGTFVYQSGTDPQMQVQMGLFGAIVVYPNIRISPDDVKGIPTDDPTVSGGISPTGTIHGTDGLPMSDGEASAAAADAKCAYESVDKPGTCDPQAIFEKDRENILILSEVDPGLHGYMEQHKTDPAALDMDAYPGAYQAHYYMINGRSMPDTIAPNNAPWLPGQPMGALATVQPWDVHTNPLDAMLRYVSVGVTGYDFHPHSNHEHVIATDASLMKAKTLIGVDNNTEEKFNIMVAPGSTVDATFRWTNEEGYSPVDGINKHVPVQWPTGLNLTEGDFWSGSPYLGASGKLNPGILTKTQCGEYYHVAHSHDLTQVTNYGVTFGGMLTLIKVEPPQGVQDINGKCNG
ncbi:MAG: multicopper oxidase domain-containing protein [Actinomycetota bacterium]